MNEQLFLGGCPLVRPEGIYLNGRRVIATVSTGVGDVGDLFAYRQMWEPFIAAHLRLWDELNTLLEGAPEAKQCPAGIFDMKQIMNMSTVPRSFCAALLKTRMYTSGEYKLGIRPQWNAWLGRSSAEHVAGAREMLAWHQSVVMLVGGKYKDELIEIYTQWADPKLVELPPVPSFSAQQELIARIEGAYSTVKGALQIIGYGAAETLEKASTVAQAVTDGLSDTARELPKTTRWIGIAVGVTAVVVAGGLLLYYVPRRSPPPPQLPASY